MSASYSQRQPTRRSVIALGLAVSLGALAPTADAQILKKLKDAATEHTATAAVDAARRAAERTDSAVSGALDKSLAGIMRTQFDSTGRIVLALKFSDQSDAIDDHSAAALRAVAQLLAPRKDAVLIEAHTVPTTDPGADALLSMRRAIAVRERLVTLGIAAARLMPVGYGAARHVSGPPGGAHVELAKAQ